MNEKNQWEFKPEASRGPAENPEEKKNQLDKKAQLQKEYIAAIEVFKSLPVDVSLKGSSLDTKVDGAISGNWSLERLRELEAESFFELKPAAREVLRLKIALKELEQ